MQNEQVKGIRDVLREVFDEISDSDQILRQIGLERRRSRAPYWLATAGVLGGGYILGSFRNQILGYVGLAPRARREMQALPLLLFGCAAGAGLTVFLSSPQGGKLRRATGAQLRHAKEALLPAGDSQKHKRPKEHPGRSAER